MKSIFTIISLIFGQHIFAQTFTEATGTSLEDVRIGSIAFADVDGDNDQDVLITGRNNFEQIIAKLYTNDGMGNYSEVMDTPFEGVFFSSIAFADVDGDNDQDVLISGKNDSNISIAKLYTNDGTGNFSEVMGTLFEGVHTGEVAFADVDADNDQDVLITGQDNFFAQTAKLYLNDGMGNYNEMMGTPFIGIQDGTMAFADVDNDNDQDVLIIGWNNSTFSKVAKLYHNDGLGNYSGVADTPFEGTTIGSIAFADVDGDNFQDVIVTGQNNSEELIAKLYINNGLGNFSEEGGTPFEGVFLSSIAFADVDGDNDQDILITGKNTPTFPTILISKLYTNDGSGIFTEVSGTPFEEVNFSSIAFADVDNDNDQDVLITGWIDASPSTGITKLYINDGVVDLENVKAFDFDFKLFPNPTGIDKINLSYISKNNSAVDIKISDLNGRVLKQLNKPIGIGQQNISIDISKLSKGSYFIELNDGVRKSVQQFLVH